MRPFNFCPACRSDEIHFLQSKLIHCKSCDFRYFHNIAAAVCGLIRHGDEVLFAVRAREPSAGLLDFPGGFADPGESLEQALQREIREELGLDITPGRYLFSNANTYHYEGVIYRTTDALFEILLPEKPAIEAADDVAAVRWLRLKDVASKEIAFDSVREAITLLRNTDPVNA